MPQLCSLIQIGNKKSSPCLSKVSSTTLRVIYLSKHKSFWILLLLLDQDKF